MFPIDFPRYRLLINKRPQVKVYTFLAFFVLFFVFSLEVSAQSEAFIIVEEILVEGAKKTKTKTILRELDFQVGDTLLLENVKERLKQNESFVYNTALFNEVRILLGTNSRENRTAIRIELIERWYWFVIPVFELADRNFNVWWTEQNRDWSRTKYGFSLLRYNMRGRNETLSLGFRWGYNRKVLFDYNFPFIDKKKIYGLSLSTHYYADRELGANTLDNKWQFIRNDGFSNNRFSSGFTISRRKEITNAHYLSAFYHRNSITENIVSENSDFYGEGRTQQKYVALEYSFEVDRRDVHRFPLNGYYFRSRLQKWGLGLFDDLDVLFSDIAFSKYQKLAPKFYAGINMKGRFLLNGTVPYFNRSRVGFLENFVRGYEYYVVDANHFALGKLVLRYQLLDLKFDNPLLGQDEFATIPLKLFVKIHHEMGWTEMEEDLDNPLNGKLLRGTGIGLDLYTFYDMLMTLDFTVNGRGEKGIYLHFNVTWDYWKKR